MEIFKKIDFYEYEVSNLGNVNRIESFVCHHNSKHGLRKIKAARINPCFSSNGYKVITVSKNPRKKLKVHRLVAEAFLCNPNNFKYINHKNGIKHDNRIENLEWCTHAQNVKHAWETGLNTGRRGKKYPVSKNFCRNIKVDLFNVSGLFINTFNSMGDAARKLNIRQSSVSQSIKINSIVQKKYVFKKHMDN